MSISLTDTYARLLAALEGNAFQLEVCTRLGAVILSFQNVPAKPHGDAGLDAFSHNGGHGYCCYGPEHMAFTNNQARVGAIVKKFSADLRRLFELDLKSKRLVPKENSELATILPRGQRLKHITLIANWFESHRITGPLLTNVAAYKAISSCRYMDPAVDVIVLGPTELANLYAVDEMTIARVQQRTFIERVQESAGALAISDPRDFDWKMQVLQELRPDQTQTVRDLAEALRADWRTALAFERELDDTLPTLHHALERARQQMVSRVAQLMLSSSEPWTQLPCATELVEELLERDFGQLYGSLVPSVSSGEIARLIGECTIGWSRRTPAHG